MLEKIFDLKANGTSVRQELRAGLTSFMAMCYLIFVVPSMLADAGMPRESAVAAVIWVTIAITLLMGLWARFPVGVAPGLGITAFFAYYVCGPAGYSWQTGLGAVFISGVFFMLLTVTRVRQMIIDAVPMDLKYAIVVGIGAFIAFIGLKNCGIVVADPSTFVTLGPLTKPEALLALGGLALMAMLMCLRVPGSMIIGILTVTVAGVLCGVTAMPEQAFSGFSLPLPTETFMQMDLKGALHHGLISIIFTLTMVDLFDNMGVLNVRSFSASNFQTFGVYIFFPCFLPIKLNLIFCSYPVCSVWCIKNIWFAEPRFINLIILLITNPRRSKNFSSLSDSSLLNLFRLCSSWLYHIKINTRNQLYFHFSPLVKFIAVSFIILCEPQYILLCGLIFEKKPQDFRADISNIVF